MKVIYSYFDNLSLNEKIKETLPNFQSAKDIILSYFTLNDILLGKVIGEKEDQKEILQLESVLQILASNTEFKVNVEDLRVSIGKVVLKNELERAVEDSREIFKSQLKSISSIFSSSVINKKLE